MTFTAQRDLLPLKFYRLFPNDSYLHPNLGPMGDDPIQKTLLRLTALARLDELVGRATLQLELNNNRAAQACIMLDILLQGYLPRLDG